MGGQGVPLCSGPITPPAYRAVNTFVPSWEGGCGKGVKADFCSRQSAHYLAKIVTVESDSDMVHAHRHRQHADSLGSGARLCPRSTVLNDIASFLASDPKLKGSENPRSCLLI